MLYCNQKIQGENVAHLPRLHRWRKQNSYTHAFALPTILIASIVMLTVLVVGASATSSTRTALQSQYYEQLAHAAGDAGVAYARACLNANGNTPLWTDSQPLMPNTNCSGTVTTTCPDGVNTFFSGSTPAICSVMMANNVRSSFSVKKPTVDSNNDATTIPNSGFVQLLRASTGAPWRTYTQQATQAAAVPALCSGAATSALGWSSAVISSTPATFPDAGVATVALSAAAINPGPTYFRKDFNITTAGSYNLKVMGDDYSTVWLDGVPMVSTSGYSSVGSSTVSLSPGCHNIYVEVTNANVFPNGSNLTFDLKLSGTTIPVVTTDTSWRVSAGNAVHYSDYGYYVDSAWTNALAVRTSISGDANWAATSGDSGSTFIASPNSNSGGNYPPSEWTNFRDPNSIVVSTNTDVRVTVQCDDNCAVYMDGNNIISNAPWGGDYTTTLTLTVGTHYFGVASYNAGATANPSGFSFAAVRVSDGVILTHSNTTWLGANYWNTSDPNPYSYDNLFAPNPDVPVPRSTNIATDFSTWTLVSGATYSSGTGQLTLPAGSYAYSPVTRVSQPTMLTLGGDFYATTASPYAGFTPNGGYHVGISYYLPDMATPATNSTGYTSNGCAESLTLNVWSYSDMRCSWFSGGSAVEYVRYTLYSSSSGYASPGLIIKNPQITLQ